MTAQEIRQKFLDFFKEKGHLIVPSAPLVLKNDPTLMFTNSGMAQFKDFFLGNGAPPSKRIADTQKCLRVTGKHNDLEDVGHDTYHHTMFEMLGNWSFGDYFKKDALEWSWELLTKVYGLPKERLYASVFGGDESEKLEKDGESYDIWKRMLPEDHILFGSKKDNFWEMGDTGPCGPCSEIHIDLRPEEEVKKIPGRELVNGDHPQVVEIWNNVFMQFERMADKSLRLLPAQHVDTGMGFERLCMAIQGKTSNYDTDIFQPLIQLIAHKANCQYGKDNKKDIAMRVIADHIRAISFTIADGQLPSNNKAGYVIRRILRRAVRYGYTYLAFKEPFLYSLVPLLSAQFKEVFPELIRQQEFIMNVIREEEHSFLRTLETGLKRIEAILEEKKYQPGDEIDGKIVFELYDTFGFPDDLTALIARENQLGIDKKGFNQEMQAQKERARNAQSKELEDWVELNPVSAVEFVGYDVLWAETQIVKYRQVKTKDKTQYQIVLAKTPFYAESGGQVGDTGELEFMLGEISKACTVKVIDTQKENDLIIHIVEDDTWLEWKSQLATMDIRCQVDECQRNLISANHSATHLMHSALREVLGNHVAQKGQLVNAKALRFDFSHFAKITEEELSRIEQMVNEKIRENIALEEKRSVPVQVAVEEMKAIALFGEKYGEFVRVITFDQNFSRELCGGTHVRATGQIGLFKIISESSSSAGVRRIEAYTSENAEAYLQIQLRQLEEIREILKNPKDLIKSIVNLMEEKSALQKKVEAFELQQVQNLKNELAAQVQNYEGVNFLATQVKVPSADALKQLAFDLKAKVNNLFAVLATQIDGKPQIAVMIADNLVKEKGYHAGNIVKELAKEIQGGGGGQPFYATAGGKDLNGLGRVVEKSSTFVK